MGQQQDPHSLFSLLFIQKISKMYTQVMIRRLRKVTENTTTLELIMRDSGYSLWEQNLP